LRKTLLKADPLLTADDATQLVASFTKENIAASESSKEQPWKAGALVNEVRLSASSISQLISSL